MSSRKGKCPGCKTQKSNHQFGSPGKHCPGPVEDAVDDTEHEDNSDEPSTSVLLAAIRSLSSQMENIQLQHDTLKKEVKANQSSRDTQAQSTLQTTAPETKQATPPTAGSLAPNITDCTSIWGNYSCQGRVGRENKRIERCYTRRETIDQRDQSSMRLRNTRFQ